MEKHREIVEDLLVFFALIGSQQIPSALLKSWRLTNGYDEFSFTESLSNLVKYNLVSSHYYAKTKEHFFSIPLQLGFETQNAYAHDSPSRPG